MADGQTYLIQIEGWIGERWAHWFEDTIMCFEQAPGRRAGRHAERHGVQAALRGLLSRIWDLNLTVLAVTRVESRGAKSDDESQAV